MSDTTTEAATANEPGEAAPPSEDRDHAGLLAGLKAEREKRQAVETELQKFRDAQAAAEQAAAEKRGEFEALYQTESEKSRSLAEKVAKYEAREEAREAKVAASNATRLEALPEAFRAGVSALPEGTSPDVIASVLTAQEAAAGVATIQKGGMGGASRGGNAPGLTAEQEKFKALHNPNGSDEAIIRMWKSTHP